MNRIFIYSAAAALALTGCQQATQTVREPLSITADTQGGGSAVLPFTYQAAEPYRFSFKNLPQGMQASLWQVPANTGGGTYTVEIVSIGVVPGQYHVDLEFVKAGHKIKLPLLVNVVRSQNT